MSRQFVINLPYRWIAQDGNGAVYNYKTKPTQLNCYCFTMDMFVRGGCPNPNWEDTLIDLDNDNYTFIDGILKKVEKVE